MRLPTESEKKKMHKDMRSRFIHIVNNEKFVWEELTAKEKKEVDKLCEKFYSKLQF